MSCCPAPDVQGTDRVPKNVALRHEAGEKREIGVSCFCMSDDGTSCECAVAVADEWQGRGLGHLLMRHLI